MFEDRDVSFSPCHSPYLVPEVATEARSLNSPREKSRIGVTEARGLHSIYTKTQYRVEIDVVEELLLGMSGVCAHEQHWFLVSLPSQPFPLSCAAQLALPAGPVSFESSDSAHRITHSWDLLIFPSLSLSLSLFLSLSLSSPLSLSLPLPPFSLFILCLPFFLELVHLRHWTP